MKKTLSHMAFIAGAMLLTASVQAEDASRSITRVTGDVFRLNEEAYFSLVTITDEGVVVVDPISSGAAGWLKRNLSQITDKPISHLIYSHSHTDHASGGVYLRAKTVIAHANAPKTIDGVKPTDRFDDTMTFETGGKKFELTWLGEGHSKDLIAVVVRPENVAFIVDVASPKRLPWRDMPHSDVDGMIAQIKKLQSLDFEIFAPGHGTVGVKADLDDVLRYMQELRAEVLTGLKAGKSVEELKASITMEQYKDWSAYKSVGLNIQGMARHLTDTGKVD